MRKTFKVQTADKRMKLLFNNEQMENLVEQAEAHVIVLLLGLFLLLLLLGGLNVGKVLETKCIGSKTCSLCP